MPFYVDNVIIHTIAALIACFFEVLTSLVRFLHFQVSSSQDLCLRTRPTELGPTLELDTVGLHGPRSGIRTGFDGS
jgi:hypothetical protein